MLTWTLTALLQLGAATAQAQGRAGLPDFTELVERVGPAVVNVRTAVKPVDARTLERLRRMGVAVPRRGGDDAPLVPRGEGSGFLISADGVLLTNAHVVTGADEVTVTLTDRREFKAKVLGADARTDVAVLKIDAQGLPAVRIGQVDRLKVGAWVVAIGSPFGLDNSVTAGIVSAKARDIGAFQRFIQTDVAINVGNSGGPLLNLQGEVVGINSRILGTDPENPTWVGISLAIPIDEAMRVARELQSSGRVVRGRIGIESDLVTREIADAMKMAQPMGAYVRRVQPGSPAEQAGVEPGDVVLSVDGKSVERATDLARLVSATAPGTRARLRINRLGEVSELVVTVGQWEDERTSRAPEAAPSDILWGLSLDDPSDAQRSAQRLRGGARVQAAQGPAGEAGMREGDLLIAVDNVAVSDAAHARQLLGERASARSVVLLVRRDGLAGLVTLRADR